MSDFDWPMSVVIYVVVALGVVAAAFIFMLGYLVGRG